MAAVELQTLLRFLTQDAKVPLATAISKVKDLQAASLGSPELLAKAKAKDIVAIFDDEKVAKQIISAAKRLSKKRAAGEDITPSPKKSKKYAEAGAPPTAPTDLEAALALPTSELSEDDLRKVVIYSNRAPLFLAFTLTLLKYTMPEQPLSSRLSLAQAFISTSSRSRAVSLGIQTIDKADVEAEKSLAEGQPVVTIMGKELPVLRRWGYEWRTDCTPNIQDSVVEGVPAQTRVKREAQISADADTHADADETKNGRTEQEDSLEQPALWALDLEALRKSNKSESSIATANTKAGNNSGLPIYTPQSARAYLVKAFDAPSSEKIAKTSAAARLGMKERNLGHLLRALEMQYESWSAACDPVELDQKTWGWYVKVRPDVEQGVAGWGGKNEIKLADILALRRHD
ncbi:hypothetical protein LTR62_007677 [Meristemomyces frigidus]|uniref:Impact N-terminal domain-containing protein n=1 Tax=Meristemomyces frigidus TaxID=1508187 RepID=A0AAN7YDH1_9PEZI|nr:hypothetical protein LTR62_007677 [Meristemomyces frigidus]